MKKSKFADSQIIDVLKRAEAGIAAPEICRELGISIATFYNWRDKYGGVDVSLMAKMKELEAENARLRKRCMSKRRSRPRSSRRRWQKKIEAIYPPRDGQRRSSTPEHIDPACVRGIWHQPDVQP